MLTRLVAVPSKLARAQVNLRKSHRNEVESTSSLRASDRNLQNEENGMSSQVKDGLDSVIIPITDQEAFQ